MFGPVDQSGSYELVRILRQNCSLGCSLQALAGVRSLLSLPRFVSSIEVKKLFSIVKVFSIVNLMSTQTVYRKASSQRNELKFGVRDKPFQANLGRT